MRMNRNKIYLDYAATTPVDPRVLKAMKPYFSENFGNPGSLHNFGQAASRAVFLARRTIAQAIGADYREIIFTGSATEANNMALRGAIADLRRRYADPRGNNVSVSQRQVRVGLRPRLIVSAIEHESILETAKDLEHEGVEVIYLPVSRAGFVDLKKLQASLNERTVLVSIMYANNEIGTIQPIAKISKIIRDFRNARNVQNVGDVVTNNKNKRALASDPTTRTITTLYPLLHTDAVQALQYLDCDVNNLGVELMTLSAHKIYGPKGIGALYVRNWQLVNSNWKMGKKSNYQLPITNYISPIITGGGQEFGLRSGTENVPYIVGFAKAVEIATKLRKKESLRIKKLRDYFFKNIKRIYPQSDLNGPELEGARLPNNLNIYFPRIKANEFLIKLDLAGVAASTGSACSSRLHEPSHVLKAIGLNARRGGESVRFTLGRGTTKSEIDKTIKVIKNLFMRY